MNLRAYLLCCSDLCFLLLIKGTHFTVPKVTGSRTAYQHTSAQNINRAFLLFQKSLRDPFHISALDYLLVFLGESSRVHVRVRVLRKAGEFPLFSSQLRQELS